MLKKDELSINLATESGRLDYAQQLWTRFCEDMQDGAGKAQARLIAGIQIAIREAVEGGHIEPLIYTKAA